MSSLGTPFGGSFKRRVRRESTVNDKGMGWVGIWGLVCWVPLMNLSLSQRGKAMIREQKHPLYRPVKTSSHKPGLPSQVTKSSKPFRDTYRKGAGYRINSFRSGGTYNMSSAIYWRVHIMYPPPKLWRKRRKNTLYGLEKVEVRRNKTSKFFTPLSSQITVSAKHALCSHNALWWSMCDYYDAEPCTDFQQRVHSDPLKCTCAVWCFVGMQSLLYLDPIKINWMNIHTSGLTGQIDNLRPPSCWYRLHGHRFYQLTECWKT